MAHSFLPPLSSYSVKLRVQFQKLALVLWNFICSVSKQRLQAYVSWEGLLGEHKEGLSSAARTHRRNLYTDKAVTDLHASPSPSLKWVILWCRACCFSAQHPAMLSHSEIKAKSLDDLQGSMLTILYPQTFSLPFLFTRPQEPRSPYWSLKRLKRHLLGALYLLFPQPECTSSQYLLNFLLHFLELLPKGTFPFPDQVT